MPGVPGKTNRGFFLRNRMNVDHRRRLDLVTSRLTQLRDSL